MHLQAAARALSTKSKGTSRKGGLQTANITENVDGGGDDAVFEVTDETESTAVVSSSTKASATNAEVIVVRVSQPVSGT